MSSGTGFRSAIVSLWFRLISIGIVGLVFAESLVLATGKAQGWSYFLSTPEVIFELLVRLVFTAFVGIALGTVCTLIVAPLLFYFKSSRDRVVLWATNVAVVAAVLPDSWYAFQVLLVWSNRAVRFHHFLLTAFPVAFALALCIPRLRNEILTSLDAFTSERMSRRTAMAVAVLAVALIATEFAFGRALPGVKASPVSERPKSNFLLITFDALNAEDMSLYGRKLNTTPNLDAFATKATVFTNFYSTSTFTTPGVAAVMTGRYPSESTLFHLEAQARGTNKDKNLPHAMRAAGYSTGAFVSNPLAYYFTQSIKSDFDHLPEPSFHPGAFQHLWDASRPLHQDSGIGSRIDEYFDLESIWDIVGMFPHNISFRLRPAASFANGQQMLANLPDGFFLWVHVVAPHDPYLPDSSDLGRFMPAGEPEESNDDGVKTHYDPQQQPLVDRSRLGYDEYIASTDRAFGAFISQLESSGRLKDTTVIVSADHGESFEGGVYRHRTPYLTRPVIHIPLIIRTPGQQAGQRVSFTADQTALAPTILELAGQSKPDFMHGQSLVGWLNRDGQGDGEGLAFTQYLEKNRLSKPLRRGNVSVIDGHYEYVLDVETQKGALRPLNQAQIWNLDRTSDNPARADALRSAIYSRFPELRKQSK